MHRVTQAQRLGLANINAVDMRGNDVAHDFECFGFVFFFQLFFKFRTAVKIVGNRLFGTSRDENQGLATCLHRFAHCVINHGSVDHGEHFFGYGFGRRQKARAHASNGEYGFTKWFHDASLLNFRIIFPRFYRAPNESRCCTHAQSSPCRVMRAP